MNPQYFQGWQLWQQVPNANEIAAGLKDILPHWSLTPLREKRPYRDNWQNEASIPHHYLATWLLNGEEKISTKGNPYRAYISGYGLRTGDASGGLVAIDIDGVSAEPLLQTLSGDNVPQTVSWTSSKPGRRQILFQVPGAYHQQLAEFNRAVITRHGDVKTTDGEILELRYNSCQSVLPPSRHPQTGAYHWLNSPSDCEVAIAPQWLCELLLNYANQEREQAIARGREAEARQQEAETRRQLRQQSKFTGTPPIDIFLTRDDQELIASGAGQGERDDKGFKLAANIHGTMARLQGLGIPFEGSGEQLFEEYAAQCSPPLSSRDVARIWKSGSKKSNPSLHDDQLEKRYSWWQWQQNPQPQTEPQISRKEWESKFQLPQQLIEIGDFVKETYNKVAWKFWKRTGELPLNPQPNPQTEQQKKSSPQPVNPYAIVLYKDWQHWTELKLSKITYEKAKLLSKEEWQKLGCPVIEFKGGSRLPLLKELYQKWDQPVVFESSDVGQGKSHDAGKLTSGYLTNGKGRVFYSDVNHRNPSVETVERNFADQISRHNGLKQDKTRKTASGYNHVVRPKPGEATDIAGNCPETETFLLLNQDKNLITHGGKNSPICEICPHFKDDQGKLACGFILDRIQTLHSDQQIRQHLDQSVPGKAEKVEGTETTELLDVFIVEEVGASLNPYKNTLVTKRDLAHSFQELKQHDGKLASIVEPLYQAIYSLIDVKELPDYGLDFISIRSRLLTVTPKVYEAASVQYWDKWVAEGWADGVPKSSLWRFISDAIKKALSPKLSHLLNSRQSPEEKQQIIKDNVPLNWISLVLDAISLNQGYLRIDHAGLHITRYNGRYHSIMDTYKMVIFQDATISPDDLARRTRIKKDDIVQIQQVKPDYSNLTITLIKNMGSGSKQRREDESVFSLQNRMIKLVTHIQQLNTERTGLIDHQGFYSQYDGLDVLGYWGRDNRGSNEFMNCPSLILIGKPLPNLGQSAAEYYCETNNLTAPTGLSGRYGHWIMNKVRGEIYQGIGRMRAHLRKHQQLNAYIVSNDAVTAALLLKRFPGCQVKEVDVYDFCPEAASKGVQRSRGLMTVLFDALKDNPDVATTEIAEQLGIVRSRVSQIVSAILKPLGVKGGFDELKRLLILFIDTLKTKLTPLEDLPDELRWIAENYLPLVAQESSIEVVKKVIELSRVYGSNGLRRILSASEPETLLQLLSSLLGVLLPNLSIEATG